nr:zinc finger BED domain-containing protein RICESLEEPER 2 [Tanacetum cinerariifolium]
MMSQSIAHGFRKIIRYDISPENPISNKDLEQMVLNMVEETMGVLFEMYKERYGFDSSSSGMSKSMEPQATSPSHGDKNFLNDFYNGNDTNSIETETELQRYLKETKVRKSRKLVNVDRLEDLLNDDEIMKDMEYEHEKTNENDQGEQNMEKVLLKLWNDFCVLCEQMEVLNSYFMSMFLLLTGSYCKLL